jgi:hypothetical protein
VSGHHQTHLDRATGQSGKKEADSTFVPICRFNVLQDGYKSQADFSGKCGADPPLAPVQILSKTLIWTVAVSHTTTRPCPLPICNDNQTVSDTQISFVQKRASQGPSEFSTMSIQDTGR